MAGEQILASLTGGGGDYVTNHLRVIRNNDLTTLAVDMVWRKDRFVCLAERGGAIIGPFREKYMVKVI